MPHNNKKNKNKNKTKKNIFYKTKKYKAGAKEPKSKKSKTIKKQTIKKTVIDRTNPSSNSETESIRKPTIIRRNIHTQQPNIPQTLSKNDLQLKNEIIQNCTTINECLTFGIYGSYVKQYFEYFNNLSLINNDNITKLTESKNGGILKIPFKKHELISYVILKYPLLRMGHYPPDNLFYEYYVGTNFVNNLINIFPSFLETYNCYTGNIINMRYGRRNVPKIQNNASWTNFFLTRVFGYRPPVVKNDNINLVPFVPGHDIWDSACKYNDSICITLQYFDQLHSIEYALPHMSDYEIICFLYQVYFPLAFLGNSYTHYDLHMENVQAYRTENIGRIHYHTDSESEIIFYTNHIAKIIDYGRNYFNNGTISTSDILLQVCDENSSCNSEKDKNEHCGNFHGFSSIQGDLKPTPSIYYIFPNKPNISHDLRFANHVQQIRPDIIKIFADNIIYENDFGTPEISTNTFTPNNKIISNIFDMKNALEFFLLNNPSPQSPFNYEIHIYSDGRDYTYSKI